MFTNFFKPVEVKVTEAGLPMNQSHDALRNHLHAALKVAHDIPADSWSADTPWVSDVFPSHVVYSHKGGMFKRPYTVTQGAAGADPSIKLGAAKPVHRAYADSKVEEAEAVMLSTEAVADIEDPDAPEVIHESVLFTSAIKVKEGKSMPSIPVKIIGAGWGSMAYYPKEVLKRDGPKVYTKGTQMFWNHATESQESERPEGDLNDLAAVLTKDAEWRDNGPKGPGLYSEAKVFSDYADQVREKGAHIGISINAAIKGREGEAEGRRGRIAESLVRAFSVDFVTKAGAGGAPVVPVTEAQRPTTTQETAMTDEEKATHDAMLKENTDLKGRLAKVEESQNQVLAFATVGAVLKEAGIPFVTKVLERACATPTMKDGKVDEGWVKSVVMDFSEGHGGTISGFGEVRESDGEKDDLKVSEKRLRESLKALGVPEQGLDYAVAGRA